MTFWGAGVPETVVAIEGGSHEGHVDQCRPVRPRARFGLFPAREQEKFAGNAPEPSSASVQESSLSLFPQNPTFTTLSITPLAIEGLTGEGVRTDAGR